MTQMEGVENLKLNLPSRSVFRTKLLGFSANFQKLVGLSMTCFYSGAAEIIKINKIQKCKTKTYFVTPTIILLE